MEKSSPVWRQFENLVRRILEANKFDLRANEKSGEVGGFDLIATYEAESWAIEVKYYRTSRAQPSLVEAAAARLVNRGRIAQAWKAMLVVSCVLPPALRQVLEEKYTVTFADRADLKNWAAVSPNLSEELDAFIEIEPATAIDVSTYRTDPRERSKPLSGDPPVDTRGTALCAELKLINRGSESWEGYERVCEKILRYLFLNDLHGWHSQKRTDDGLNRFDYVCRVLPNTEFWRFLIDHLDSRYVLFEFKNYSGKIGQGQILTTEKYLLERGLRRVAIIFTRVGADQHAITMAQGAMREQGKLMLVVNDAKVCEMLHMKERGNDPSDRLFELADDFLLSLPR